MSAWGWVEMALGLIVVIGLLAVGVALLVHAGRRPSDAPHPQPSSSPEQLLAERFARSEIDAEEYQQRLATLRGMRTESGAG
jgi:putative membrane protein